MRRIITPDVVIELTDEQIAQIAHLKELQTQAIEGGGMILGSVGVKSDGKTIGLSYLPRAFAQKIVQIANEYLEEHDEI